MPLDWQSHLDVCRVREQWWLRVAANTQEDDNDNERPLELANEYSEQSVSERKGLPEEY